MNTLLIFFNENVNIRKSLTTVIKWFNILMKEFIIIFIIFKNSNSNKMKMDVYRFYEFSFYYMFLRRNWLLNHMYLKK